MAHGTFGFKLGEFDCTVIGDSEDENFNLNSLLVRTGQHHVLIDPGVGRNTVPDFFIRGRVLVELANMQITPDEIDVVILSHADFDHIGGALDGGKAAYPRARHVLLHEELDYWSADPVRLRENPAAYDESFRQLSKVSPRCLGFLQDRLQPVPPDTDVIPGVRMMAAGGHTPGHAMVEISSGNERLWYVGDLLYNAEDINDPDWYSVFDVDPSRAVATRKRVFPQLEQERLLMIGYHLPFPGIGYITRHGQGWTWTARNAA